MADIIYNRGDFIIATVFLVKDVSPEKKVYTRNPRGNFFDVKQKALVSKTCDDFSNKKSLFLKFSHCFFKFLKLFFNNYYVEKKIYKIFI